MRLALVLVWVFTQVVWGQSGYQDGFLLTTSLDTVRGSIRFTGKESAPGPCLFKTDKKVAPKEIFPGTVHGFCTNDGAYYYSRTLGSTTDVFLEVLAKGYMNLFKFGSVYYVEKGDSIFFELSDEWEVTTADGRPQQQHRSRNYTRMLALLMGDCPEVTKDAAKTPLKDKALVRLVVRYNKCRGSKTHLFRVNYRSR